MFRANFADKARSSTLIASPRRTGVKAKVETQSKIAPEGLDDSASWRSEARKPAGAASDGG
jgi:hypothetical protein